MTATDNLPATLSFVSCSSTGGGVCGGSGNNRTVTFASLAAGSDARITIVARLGCSVASGAVITNSATASSPIPDLVAGNNTGEVNITASNPPAVISPTSFDFDLSGGDELVTVTTLPCPWTAQSNVPWITFPSGSSGMGTSQITISVAQNDSGAARVGTATIAGQTLTVNQSNIACNYSIAPPGASFTHEGGNGQISITTLGGCTWKALSDSDWITMNADTGTGSGTATFTVAPNPGAARTGTITTRGLAFTVTQGQAPCSFSISPPSAFINLSGGDGNIEITARADCEWTAEVSASWIEIDSEVSGTGSGLITYLVRDNGTGAPRQGSITIGNAVFTVVQNSSPNSNCSFTTSPQGKSFTAAGGSGSFSLQTGSLCAWRALTNVNWITFTSVDVGIGQTIITYQVKLNENVRIAKRRDKDRLNDIHRKAKRRVRF